MAAIIKSISFQNFYNYYGSYERNTYNFTEGLNIINAVNNGGKTKFFNGILWMFQDKVYDQNKRKRVPAAESYNLMLSKKADKENFGKSVTMGVQISFVDDDDIVYVLEKFVVFNPERTPISYFKGKSIENGHDHIAESDSERSKMLDLLIPSALYNYSLLQGEYMDDLLDLSNKRAFTNTISALSGMGDIKALETSAAKWSKKADRLHQDMELETNRNSAYGQQLIETQKRLNDNIEKLEKLIREAEQKKKDASLVKDNLEAFMSAAHEREELRSEYDQIEKDLKSKKIERDNFFGTTIVSNFFGTYNPWIFYGLSNEMKEYKDMRDGYFLNIKMAQNSLSDVMLPLDSPDQPSLKRMFANLRCEVCGRPFEEHSEAWSHVKKLIERNKSQSVTKHDILGTIDKVRSSVESKGSNDNSILDELNNAKTRYAQIRHDIIELNQKRDSVLAKFSNAGGKLNDEQGQNTDKSRMDDYAQALIDIQEAENTIKDYKSSLENYNYQNKTNQKKIDELPSAANIEPYKKFKKNISLIKDIVAEARENIYNKIIDELEKASNDNYNLLTKDNQAGGGKLKFIRLEDDTVQVVIKSLDEEDEMFGLGTGFQRMKEMAILMAIMQTQIGGTKYNSPFIADAPFSEFATNFIRNFIDVTPSVFKQEIILTKDTVEAKEVEVDGDVIVETTFNDLGEELKAKFLNKEIRGTFYLNLPSSTPNQSELETEIKSFN